MVLFPTLRHMEKLRLPYGKRSFVEQIYQLRFVVLIIKEKIFDIHIDRITDAVHTGDDT